MQRAMVGSTAMSGRVYGHLRADLDTLDQCRHGVKLEAEGCALEASLIEGKRSISSPEADGKRKSLHLRFHLRVSY